MESANGEPDVPVQSNISEQAKDLLDQQFKFMRDVMKSLFECKCGEIFRYPVDPDRDNLPDYFDIIKSPIDLSTIITKIEGGNYIDVAGIVADFQLMVKNCFTYNPVGSVAEHQGKELERLFNKKYLRLPTEIVPCLPMKRRNSARKPEDKSDIKSKPSKQKKSVTPEDASSITSHKENSRSSKRQLRDPVLQDEDRPILAGWYNFCNQTVNELFGKKHHDYAYPFLSPVDPVALKIPDYHDIIKYPMDLGTIRNKLKAGQYTNPKQVLQDVRLVFNNCFRYNAPDTEVYICGQKLQVFSSITQHAFEHAISGCPPEMYKELFVPDDIPSEASSMIDAPRVTRRSQYSETRQITEYFTNIDKKLQTLIEDVTKIKNEKGSKRQVVVENGQCLIKKPASKINPFNLVPPKPPVTVPHQPKIEPVKVEDADPMTYDEKLNLSSRIMCQPESRLLEILALINQKEPWSKKLPDMTDKQTVEIDLNSLQSSTLRAIEKHLTTISRKKSEANKRKKRTPEDKHTRELDLRKRLETMENQLAGKTPIPLGPKKSGQNAQQADTSVNINKDESSESDISDEEFSKKYNLGKSATGLPTLHNAAATLLKSKGPINGSATNKSAVTNISAIKPTTNIPLSKPQTSIPATATAAKTLNSGNPGVTPASKKFVNTLMGGGQSQTKDKPTDNVTHSALANKPHPASKNIEDCKNLIRMATHMTPAIDPSKIPPKPEFVNTVNGNQ